MADNTGAMTIVTVHTEHRELFAYEQNQKFLDIEQKSL